jgi:methylmalonyl-CoA/ethylmalonyl-CoA epimerase
MKTRLNHIGVVVRDADDITDLFRTLGVAPLTTPEPDPIQKVTARFFASGGAQEVHIELLEPTDNTSPVANFLAKKGGGLHHLCFEVEDLDSAVRELAAQGYKVVSQPVACIGYDNSFGLGKNTPTRIAFLMAPSKLLVELLQKGN